MAKIATYLLPTVYTSNSKIPLEYRITEHKLDMRYNFCKRNIAHIIIPEQLNIVLSQFPQAKQTGDRIIIHNGKAAHAFVKTLKSIENGGSEK